MGKYSKKIMKKILMLLVTVFMVTSSIQSPAKVQATGVTQVSSFEELEQAISNKDESIEIVADFAMTKSIEIDYKVEIFADADDNHTLYQSVRDSYDSMFIVKEGLGDLTLGSNLTLSGEIYTADQCPTLTITFKDGKGEVLHTESGIEMGETKTYTPDNIDGYEFDGWKLPHDVETTDGAVTIDKQENWTVVAKWKPAVPKVTVKFMDGNGKEYASKTVDINTSASYTPSGNDIPLGYTFGGWKLPDNATTTGETVEVGTHDLTVVANWVPVSSGPGYLKLSDNRIFVKDHSSGKIQLYALNNDQDTDWTKKIMLEIQSDGLIKTSDGDYIKIQGKTPTLFSGTPNPNLDVFMYAYSDTDGTIATSSSNPIYLGYTQYSVRHLYSSWNNIDAWDIDGTPLAFSYNGQSSPDFTYTDSSTQGDEHQPAVEFTYTDTPSFEDKPCQGSTACGIYDNTKIDGSINAPKGFFVQVERGGKATLYGATLKNFYTSTNKDDTPRYVAPVVADGGTFDIVSGEISNNVVGYIVNDGMSNKDANEIKMYIKGGAPNSPRNGSGSDRRWKDAGIDAGTPGSGITGTAGAVIYVNGARGAISGGSISYNRGDTGGIMVSGEGTDVSITGEYVSIDHNVGVQWGGGSFVEDGGSLYMSNGTMSENVAWFGGGAVFATENGINWLLNGTEATLGTRKDGKFTLDGGTLENNTSFTRGGAILVDSDGVALLKGTLKKNKSRMLGGAIYVMGDDPRYTYTVYIKNGYVHENKAVSAGLNRKTPATDLSENKTENESLSYILNSPKCGENVDLFKTEGEFNHMTVNSDDLTDGPGTDGTGGGVWLCAYGNTSLNLDDNVFVVDNNYASGSAANNKNSEKPNKKPDAGTSNKTGGNDLHKDTKAGGSVQFRIINRKSEWYDENTGDVFTNDNSAVENVIIDYGLRNLVNFGNNSPDYYGSTWEGVDIVGNISRRGGGIAANGTYLLGKATDATNFFAEMKLQKIWNKQLDKEDVVVRVYVEKDNNRYVVQDVPFSNTAKQNSELDTVFVEDNYVSRFEVPIMVKDNEGNDVQVFDLKIGDRDRIDLSKTSDLIYLNEQIGAGASPTLNTSNVKFIFEEGRLDDNGNFVKDERYNFSFENVSVAKTSAEKVDHPNNQNEVNPENLKFIFNTAIYLENTIRNDNKPEIDKYVNQAVHKNIELDEVFTYDVIAYVTEDADKVVITDKLVEDLELVNVNNIKVVSLENNNHKPTNYIDGKQANDDASVAEEGTDITKEDGVTIDAKKQGSTLIVTLDDGVTVEGETINREYNTVKDLRGRWVKVTFQAQIKKSLQDEINAGTKSIADLKHVHIKSDQEYKDEDSIGRPAPNIGNSPVDSGEDHVGVPNTASYKIYVENEGKYQDESNTVTVNPEKPEIEKYVNEAVHKYIDLDEEFTYDIMAYVTMDADKVVISDELNEQLEFVSAEEDITVVDMGKNNNHKVTNNIESVKVNKDATVAKEGENLVGKKGVSVSIEGSKLLVTLDDDLYLVEETGSLDRTNTTVLNLRGHWVKVTFKAKIADGLTIEDLKYKEIKHDAEEERDEPNVGNAPVVSDEDHEGVINNANYQIFVENDAQYYDESNTVTVKPEEPEIEKYVNKDVHKDIRVDEVFTYDVLAYITQDADKFTITDELVEVLDFVGDVKVYDMGTSNDHTPVTGVVAEEGTDITKDATSISKSGKLLTVVFDDVVTLVDETGPLNREKEIVKNLRGHWVKVTFDAQIEKDIQDEINAGTKKIEELGFITIKDDKKENRDEPNVGNDPLVSDKDHTGIPNKASYEIEINNEGKYQDESNTVTVKPDKPEVEKYVNQAVHSDIIVDEVFTYDIIGYITHDANKVVFYDRLVEDLELVNVNNIKVVSLDENNHKPTNDIYGSQVNADASVALDGTDLLGIDGLTIEAEDAGSELTVTIDDGVTVEEETINRDYNTVKDLRGKYVKVTFQAQIKKELQDKIKAGEMSVTELANVTIEDNGDVLSDEKHNGIDNTAKMSLECENDGNYELESNTVTVKPEQPEIEKYINQAVHKDIELDEVFTYDIIAYITKDADKFTITDTLVSDLEFVSKVDDIKVYDLGRENNHKVVNNIYGKEVNDKEDTTVGKSDVTEISENLNINIENNTLTVSMDDEVYLVGDTGQLERKSNTVKDLRGHWVKVTFEAQIKKAYQDKINAGDMTIEELKYVSVKADEKFKSENSVIEGDRPMPNVGNDPVDSDEDHEGIENTASYTIEVFNDGQYESSGDESNTVTVKPNEFVDIPVNKTWVDNNNNDGVRPEKITVILKANDEEVDRAEFGKADGWTYTFTKLPKLSNGEEIKYTIEEVPVEGYVISYKGYNVINTYSDEVIDIKGTKTWDDNGNVDGLRPEKITVILLADGKKVDSLEISEKDDWKYAFVQLPKYAQGKEIEYTIDELDVDGYDKYIIGYDLTNKYIPFEEPKKTVNGDVDYTLENRNNILTYTISSRVPSKTASIVFEDNMPAVLEVLSTSFSVEGVEVTVNGQLVKVEITDKDLLRELSGETITLTIYSRIKASISDEELIKMYGQKIENVATVTINNVPAKTRGATFTPSEPKEDKPGKPDKPKKYDTPKTGVQ